MKEKIIEKWLVQEVTKLDGTAYKFKSPGRHSVPDRICVFPNNIHAFVECKATGKIPTEAQWREIERIRDKGHWVLVIDRRSEIVKFINKVKLMIGGE